jgi:hypothetical protein
MNGRTALSLKRRRHLSNDGGAGRSSRVGSKETEFGSQYLVAKFRGGVGGARRREKSEVEIECESG